MRATKSAELMESSSKQTSTGTPAAISSVPIAPSPHRTDPANSSRKSIGAQSLAATYKWSGAIFIYKRQNSEFRRQNSEGRMRNSEAVASNLEPQRPKRQDAGQLRAPIRVATGWPVAGRSPGQPRDRSPPKTAW